MTRPPTVVVTHPGKHYHVYEIALATQEAGMLRRFVTGVYYKRGRFPYSVLENLPGGLARRWLQLLVTKRSMPGVREELVRSMPYFEASTYGFGKLPMAGKLVSHTSLVLLNNALFDSWASRVLRKDPYDIVHAFFGCAWHSFEQAKREGRITVLDMPGTPRNDAHIGAEYERLGGKGRALSARDRAEIRLADYIFAPSDFVTADLVACGFPADRVFKIPWGVDIDQFTPGRERPGDAFRVLFVGNISLRKGFHFLLDAFDQLRLPGLELTIVGHPLDSVSEQALHRHDGCFTWIPRVPHAELPKRYQLSDVFVFPSLAEGSAMVTYEAMACGLPVVATLNTGSIVRDGQDGFIIPVRDVEAIKEKIAFLYHNRAEARRMGCAARQAIEDYTWRRYRERVISAYAQIAAESRAS